MVWCLWSLPLCPTGAPAWPAPAVMPQVPTHSWPSWYGLSAWMLLSLVMIRKNSLLKGHKMTVSPQIQGTPCSRSPDNTVGQG